MPDALQLSEITGLHMVFRYIGPGYINGVPARDLTEADLAEVEEREGITREMLAGSRIYIQSGTVEIVPFCGALTVRGTRCKRRVKKWGDRCSTHEGESL